MSKLQDVKALWTAAMPKECPMPEDFDFLLWLNLYSPEVIEYGVWRTAKKMRVNLRDGVELVPHAAQRYCASVLANRARTQNQRGEHQ
jgi:hypothetical protein